MVFYVYFYYSSIIKEIKVLETIANKHLESNAIYRETIPQYILEYGATLSRKPLIELYKTYYLE